MATETLAADTTETTDEAVVAETTDTAETVEVKRRATAVRSAPAKRRATTSESGTGTPRAASKAVSSGGPSRKNALLAAVIALLVGRHRILRYHYFTGADRADNPQTRSEVVSVANDYATKLSSFDYRDLNKNRKSITAMSTADFGKKYDEMVKALTEIVSNGRGRHRRGDELGRGVDQRRQGHRHRIRQPEGAQRRRPDGKNQPYRMVVKLVRTDGTWLVDDVQTVAVEHCGRNKEHHDDQQPSDELGLPRDDCGQQRTGAGRATVDDGGHTFKYTPDLESTVPELRTSDTRIEITTRRRRLTSLRKPAQISEAIDFWSLAGAAANVVMQLGWPEVAYGVMESKVESGSLMKHARGSGRAPPPSTSPSPSSVPTEKEAFREAVNSAHRHVKSDDRSPVRGIQRVQPRAAVVGCGVPVHRRRGQSPAAARRDERGGFREFYQSAKTLGTTLQVPDDMWPATRKDFDHYWNVACQRVVIDDTTVQSPQRPRRPEDDQPADPVAVRESAALPTIGFCHRCSTGSWPGMDRGRPSPVPAPVHLRVDYQNKFLPVPSARVPRAFPRRT